MDIILMTYSLIMPVVVFYLAAYIEYQSHISRIKESVLTALLFFFAGSGILAQFGALYIAYQNKAIGG